MSYQSFANHLNDPIIPFTANYLKANSLFSMHGLLSVELKHMLFTEVPVLHVKCQLCAPLLMHTSGVEGSTFAEGGNVFVFDIDKASLSADKSWSYKTHNPTFCI